MKKLPLKKFFPNSVIGEISQTGTPIGAPQHKGVHVELKFHDHDAPPISAEVYGGDHYADIGLEWDGNNLVGYDGVFDIPSEVLIFLKSLGYDVSQITEPEAEISAIQRPPVAKVRPLKNPATPRLDEAVEDLIDKYDIHDVLIAVSNACGDKADHISSSYQDHQLARVWAVRGRTILAMIERNKRLFT